MISRIIRLLALVALSARSLFAQSEPKHWTALEVQQILKKRIDVDKQCVGIVVGMINATGNEIVAYGSLRKSNPTTQPDRDTVYEIGSVTKVFTTLVLADMVGRGEVALSDPASKFLPKNVSVPSRDGREITLLDLATHTSALPRLPDNLAPADGLNPYADYSVEHMYDALSKCKLTRAIGEKYEYSNFGMGLLGHILALKAGKDFKTLVAERITKPLGMANTAIELTTEMKSRLATAHNEMREEDRNWDFLSLAGAGALRSTVGDMVKFVEANMGKAPSSLSDAMGMQSETRFATDTPNMSIAIGWHKLAGKGREIIWHNGQTGGYHAFIGFDRKRNVGVVVLANTAADVDDIGMHILDSRIPLKRFDPKKERIAIQVDSKLMDSYVGHYELAPSFVIAITKEDGHLMLQATGQPKFELFAESDRKFFLKVVDAQITFVKDAKETVTELILHQGGANQHAKKRAR
jgi:serine-type D-Ala-D-Ala carboxypeptidase/endopeptidase